MNHTSHRPDLHQLSPTARRNREAKPKPEPAHKVGDILDIQLQAEVVGVDDDGFVFVRPLGHNYRFMLRGEYQIVQQRRKEAARCAWCGEAFEPVSAQHRFCSEKCAADSRRKRHREKEGRE